MTSPDGGSPDRPGWSERKKGILHPNQRGSGRLRGRLPTGRVGGMAPDQNVVIGPGLAEPQVMAGQRQDAPDPRLRQEACVEVIGRAPRVRRGGFGEEPVGPVRDRGGAVLRRTPFAPYSPRLES